MGVVEIVIGVALVVAVLVAIVRDPDPVDEPAPLESGSPREAVRAAIERRDR